MKSGLRYLLASLFALVSFCVNAEKLYWVGGTGNFNDANHWSFQSGGKGGAKAPGPLDDVYFDENSFSGKSILSFIGHTEVNSLYFASYTPKVIFSGTQNEKIIIHGNLKLNSNIDNQFEGDFVLKANGFTTNVGFELAKIKGNIYFDGNTNWIFNGGINVDDRSTIYLRKGTFNFSGNAVYAGNLEASPGIVINAGYVIFSIRNKFILPAGVTYNDSNTIIYAPVKNKTKFQVSPTVVFASASRLRNTEGTLTACNITQPVPPTQPTCSGVCDGTITFDIPSATCSGNDTILAVWGNLPGCTVIPTATFVPGNTPTTYIVDSLCSSLNQYGVTFCNNVNQDTIWYAPPGIAMANPQPPQVKTIAITPPKCFGSCDGYLVMSVKNTGAFPLTSTWTAPAGSVTTHTGITSAPSYRDSLTGVCAGTYSVFLTDANGCVSPTSFTTVTQPAVVSHTITPTSLLCAGVCNGSITENLSGGTAPYTFTWTAPGGTVSTTSPNSTYSNLCAGTYTVRTTDSHGCKDSATATVTTPNPITFAKNPASGTLSINCNNVCSGSVGVINVNGGIAPYTFSWSPVGGVVSNTATGSTYSGLCGSVAGTTYTCIITDANNCTKTATFTVTSPSPLSHTITATNPKCVVGQGVSVGSMTVTESGGTSPYTFVWTPTVTVSGASPTSIGSGANPGTYSVQVIDTKGCTDTASITLTAPPPVTGTITTTTNPTCPNLNNGKLCVTAGGGSPGYTYTWSPTGGNAICTPSTLTVTPGGTSVYSVTVKDVNSCTVVVTGTLTSPPQASVSSSVTDVKCGSSPCTGSATLTVSGTPGPFTYAWSCSTSTTSVISGRCGGTSCSYTVTDQGTNCKYTGTVNFAPAPPVLNTSISGTALSCNGDCNSVITSTVSGGTAPVTYSWTPGGFNTPSISGQCAGNYTCLVTDNNGCTSTATTTVAAPQALTVSIAATQPTCSGSCDGSMLASISGGSGTYTSIVWNPAVVPPNAPNPGGLCGSTAPGQTYTLTVTDSKGCLDTAYATLIKPTVLSVSVATGSVTCSGLCNGTATATASGGTGSTYTYSWDNGAFGVTATTAALCAGTHTLVVKDSNGCSSPPTLYTIIQPNPISVTATNLVNTCGACTGSATANTLGGTAPYSYTWTPSLGNGNNNPATNLCVGNYTLTAGDANGCPTASTTFTINPIVLISISATSLSVSCNNACDGSANASASNGTAPYNMDWTSSPGGTTVTSCTASVCNATALCPGTYVITASDANGCTNKDSVVIGNPPALIVSGSQSNTSCFGTCSGTATVTPSGGVAPYTTSWSTGASGTTVSNLCAGTYTANVVDSRGCPATQTYTINSNPQFTLTPTIIPPAVCGGNGSIAVTASGGTPAYVSFAWAPPGGSVTTVSPTTTLSGVPAGVYTLTVTDSQGCDTVVQVSLSDPGTQTVSITTQSVSCFGVSDGSTTITAVGVAPISITWPVGPVNANDSLTVAPDSAGIYQVKTVDANGCVVIVPDTIKGPSKILDNPTIVNATCGAGGCVTLNPSGGIGAPYTYVWDGVPGTNSACGLTAGTHTCVISDGTPCSQTYTYNITTSSSLTVSITPVVTRCSYSSDGSVNASVGGGVPAYSYTWTAPGPVIVASGSNVSSASALAPGTYTLNVSDAGGCTLQQTFVISAASVINPNVTPVNNACNTTQSGVCNGGANAAPSGGTPGTTGYTYSWPGVPGNPTGASISNVCPGSYSVIVTDSLGCRDTAAFAIIDPPALTGTVTSTDPSCSYKCDGTATVTISGGTGTTYTVSWDGVPCPGCYTEANLCGNTQYTVTPIDSMGCSVSVFYTLNSPAAINANVTTTDPLCFNNSNGSIVSNTLGGASPYTYAWSPLGYTVTSTALTSTYSGLPANTYTLIINDAKGCSDTTSYALNNPTKVTASASSTSATCGLTNGSILISSVNGNGAVTVNWLNPSTCTTSLSCTNLGFGVYSFELTDSKGCKDTVYVPVSNPNGPHDTSFVVNVSCNGSSTGSIKDSVISGVNGNLPYVFTWTVATAGTITTTSNTSTFSNLPAGTYIGTVTDTAGCGTATSFTVTQPLPIQDNGNYTFAACVGINNATITSIASGGTGTTYTYTLDGVTTNTTGVFVGVSAGTHTVCINDSLLCSKCFYYTIPVSSSISSTVSYTNATCNGTNDGAITLSSINGGTPSYSISWSNLQTGAILTNLAPGIYTATITDAIGCQAMDTVTISAPSAIAPNATITSPACGLCNGEIDLAPTGGTPATVAPAYTYAWTGGTTADSLTNVCAGLYQVTISDSLGCSQTVQIPVSNPGSPTVTTTATSPVCSSACTGVITTTVSSASPVTYFWLPNGQTTPSINSLCAGVYFVEVKDSAGCIATVPDTITAGVTLALNATVTNPGCAVCNGAINTNVSGGTGPYTYTWMPGGATTPNISGACAGAYTLYITDTGSGCKDSIPVGLNSAANGPILTPVVTAPLCHGMCTGTASVNIFGGTAPYTTTWSNGQITNPITNLCPNTYIATVTDADGCVTTTSITLIEPDTLIRSLPIIVQPKCFGDANGSITTVISGGTPVYTYTWNPSTIVGTGGSGLVAGMYSVTISDANGCSITEFDTLVDPAMLTITGTVTPASCNTVPDASIATTTNGGTGTYSYTWSGGSSATTASLTNILVGNYSVTVTDAHNCKDSASFVVTANINVTANAGNDTTLCSVSSFTLNGSTSGATSLQWIQLPNPPGPVLGTTPSLSVTPAPGDTTSYVLVAQNGGCSYSDTINIIMNSTPLPDAGTHSTIFLGQQATIGGSPTNAGGGTIAWTPHAGIGDTTAGNPTVSPSATTQYTVYVTNAAGCVGWDTVTVTVLPTFVIPNGFSPNGDGYNETWQIDYIYMFPNCEVEVYNRWGEQLFYSKGYNTPWAGKYQGKDVPVGTYYYVIRLNDKKFPDHFAGPLTILR
ncbi:MAG: T9SS type B sorting domain-containing protein [Bacteroidia bacterium]